MCLALVVSREGMPTGYEVFAGNRTDVTTVEEIDNLEWLRETGRRHLVGTPKSELRLHLGGRSVH